MKSAAERAVPQVVATASVTANGRLPLTKGVREYLGVGKAETVVLVDTDEVRLAAPGESGVILEPDARGGVTLPDDVRARLGLGGKARVSFIARNDGLALKRFETEETEGADRIVDIETSTKLTRRIEQPLALNDAVRQLAGRLADTVCRTSPSEYLRGHDTYDAWRARQVTGDPVDDDSSLRNRLAAERIDRQEPDGSWADDVPITARNLRELAVLGFTKGDERVDRASQWLLDQPESPHNPGMFFLHGDLVAVQIEIRAEADRMNREKERGTRPRFRELKTGEKKRVAAGDPLIRTPCGPRLMWPNALAVEALASAGYESHPRVRRALDSLLTCESCECGFQGGVRNEPMDDSRVAAFEAACIEEYQRCGVRNDEHLRWLRRAREVRSGTYELRRDNHIQGCEAATTRALAEVRDGRARRFAAAHLWRFAARQDPATGRFPQERHGAGVSELGILEMFARFDHPVTDLVLLRAVPWIVATQNADGSWGGAAKEVALRDAETYAAVKALARLGRYLPAATSAIAGIAG